ncbi:MAG: NADH-quinone oxidoreductase subunit NuoG [Thermoleophilaceae bacterium]|nr:NADH-quinone oxidoreductase subunit NuoG [Thermoleophilaceae bacterium]
MPKPEPKLITFEIDGREVQAPEGMMLVDAARLGDVEIPFFCYEPKLGAPVGACRMCLVEIEGMPKLQTSCSTPVKDGMVVSTTSERVKQAQNAVVEFLLVNHPLDCPVCDKGGECPLQDISYGWGAGRSRFIEPKRHFEKPVALSPLIAIDRERCILCYRCVRFSQEIAEDYQLVFLERGDHTFVGTHDGHPYVAPFSGNIVELCPVGALTSQAYRFRARPWDIEDAGSICTLCPSQCNVKYTTRDDTRVLRVLARDNQGVDDGWLCDKGRFGYQAIHAPERVTQPLVRDGGALRPVSWERALSEAARALARAGGRSAAIVGGQATNEEGFLVQHLMREVLGSPHVDSRPSGVLDPAQARALARPDLTAAVPDIEWAGAVLVLDTELVDEMPILDLRVRKGVRRNGVRLVVATSRPSSLDPNARAVVRFTPGAGEAFLAALGAALGDGRGLDELAGRAGASPEAVRAAADALRDAGPVVVVWGERLSGGERGRQAVARLLDLARTLELAGTEGAGLLEVPRGTNARGLREVGCLPNLAPGLADAAAAGKSAGEIAAAVPEEISALLLVHADPLSSHPDRGAWERALDRAGSVIAFADFLTPGLEEHATVVFPSESEAEKDGTMTHPDGRVQRVRQAIARPPEVLPNWQVLAELCERIGKPAGVVSGPAVFERIVASVPFYEGLTLAELGGKGVRWQERDGAGRVPESTLPEGGLEEPPPLEAADLRLGTAPSLWSGPVVEHSPILRFLLADQRVELSVEDGERLGVSTGDEVAVTVGGASVRGVARLRSDVPPGSVFLVEGTQSENATALTNGRPRAVKVARAAREVTPA